MKTLFSLLLSLSMCTLFAQRSQQLDAQLQEELKVMTEHLKMDIEQISRTGVILSERNEKLRNPLSIIEAIDERGKAAPNMDDDTRSNLNAELDRQQKLVKDAEREAEEAILKVLSEEQQALYRDKTKAELKKIRAAR